MASRIQRPATAFSNDPSDRSQRRIRDDAHLAFIRRLPSVISGKRDGDRCDPCHVRTGSPIHRKKRTGASQRPDDCWTLPMRRAEHDAQHDMNELEFYRSHGITDPFSLCLALYEVSGDVKAAEMIIKNHRKSRRVRAK